MRIEAAQITVKDKLFGTSSPLDANTSFRRTRSPELWAAARARDHEQAILKCR
jgi:hypothetical protein